MNTVKQGGVLVRQSFVIIFHGHVIRLLIELTIDRNTFFCYFSVYLATPITVENTMIDLKLVIDSNEPQSSQVSPIFVLRFHFASIND